MIPQSFIQELLARVDIVDVVERYVKLRKAGANYTACCPFHSEKTPSFTVSQTKQFYHCFGCGAHGSAIGFVMEYAGLGFVDAVQELASSVGLQVPYQRPAEPVTRPERSASLTDVLARAARYYREQLKASAKAIDYLKGRGLTGEIAARFGIGYAPDGWQNLEQVFPNYRAAELAEAGLVIDSEQGRRYDRFRDRIMFPIQDGRGNVIGFGGRVLGGGEPKYLNSPETPLFQKGHELYGLPQAREAIRAHDTVIVVEGYMDVVALAQHGIGNAVATLGTATTGSHLRKLLRQAGRVVFCFDGDAPGRKAAWRALEASIDHLSENKGASFLFLPEEHDPDSYVRDRGADEFRRQAAQATPLSDFLLQELRNRGNPASVEGRSLILHDAKPLLARIQAPILRLQLTRALADLTRSTVQEIESLCELKPLVRTPPIARPVARRAPPSIARTLLKIVVQKPGWAPGLTFDLLPTDPEGQALRALCDAVDHGEIPAGNFATIIEYFRGSEHAGLLDEIAVELETESIEESAMEAVFNDALDQLQRAGLSREIADLNAKASASGLSPEERQRLTQLLSAKARLREPGPAKGLL